MTVLAMRRPEADETDPAEDRLDWLAAQIVRNRFLPIPPPERICPSSNPADGWACAPSVRPG